MGLRRSRSPHSPFTWVTSSSSPVPSGMALWMSSLARTENETAVLKTGHYAERCIKARRAKTGQDTLYVEFQHLAQKWARPSSP